MPAPLTDIDINEHYAKFATTSRLVACLTSEALVPAHFVPAILPSDEFVGLCLLLRPVKKEEHIPSSVTIDSILAVIPLRGMPIFDNTIIAHWNGITCPRIDLVDSVDMQPHIYNVVSLGSAINHEDSVYQTLKSVISGEIEKFQLVDGYDAVSLWNNFATDFEVSDKLIQQIGQELASSISFQSKIFLLYMYVSIIFFY